MSEERFGSFNDGEKVADSKVWNEEEESCDVDPDYLFAYDEEERMYCEVCRCSMSGPKTFESHLAGARHKRNVKTCELGAPVRSNRTDTPTLQLKDGKRVNWRPKCQSMIDAFEQPLIGLRFITEWCHRNRFVEPRYYCCICKAKCDIRLITSHLTGVKHRVAYMKLFYPEMATKVKAEGRKIDQAPLAEHFAKRIEEQEGRQPLRVKAEGFPDYKGDDDDKELEEFVAANKQNFYRHLRGQGLPTSSEYWKSGGARGGRGSQPTFGSSRMPQSSPGFRYSDRHPASESGYDSVFPSGYQPARSHLGFDSHQPQRLAVSGPMLQSRPHYDEESDYRGQPSPGYTGFHSVTDYDGYGGRSGGDGGQSPRYTALHLDTSSVPSHRHLSQKWFEDEPRFDTDRFQSDMTTSSRNSFVVRPGPSFPSYSAECDGNYGNESGPSHLIRGSRRSEWPYPANRPSRFPARGALNEGHARYQNRYQ